MIPWLSKRVRSMKVIVPVAAALLAISVSWGALGLPRPAMTSDLDRFRIEIGEVRQFNFDTRALLLNQEWARLHQQLSSMRLRLAAQPTNVDLVARISNAEAQLRAVTGQLEMLRNKR